MSFNAPFRLWLLVAVAALLVAYVLLQRRRRHGVVRFTNVDLLGSVAPKRPGWRRHVPAAALLLALAVMVLGFARPTRKVDVARNGAIVVLAIDVSDSMKATDVAPNRITVARRAAKEFVQGLPKQFKVSLIAFSGSANVLLAPTTDHEEALRRLEQLKLAPNTAIGEAIFTALEQIRSAQRTTANKPPAARIVLLSDGNTTVGRSTEEAAAAAADARVPVSTIAYGTDQGTVVAGGQTIRVPVDRVALRATAETTGGTYFEAATGSQLKQVYKDIGTEIDLVAQRQELTPWFAGLALAVAVTAAAMGLMWAPRLPEIHATDTNDDTPLTVGVWGTFDVENYGDHLFPRIARRELQRRLPHVHVRAYSPLGWLHPVPMDNGEPAETLGAWDEARPDQLAAELDAVLIGGGEIIHTEDALLAPAYGVSQMEMRDLAASRYFIEGLGPKHERTRPVLWHGVGLPFDPTPEDAARFRRALNGRAYVSVRDERSRARLLDAGVETEITVVPDSAVLVPRVLARPLLAKRLEYLRAMEWFPADGDALVVQGSRDLLPFVPEVAATCTRLIDAHPELTVALVSTGPCNGDDEFARALVDALAERPGRRFRLPPEAGVEDLAAAISNARLFVGSSLHGAITALAFGRSFVTLNLLDQSKLDGFGRLAGVEELIVDDPVDIAETCERALKTPDGTRVARLQDRVDEHFDRMATIIDAATQTRSLARGGPRRGVETLETELRAARAAHEALARRVRAERRRLADHVQSLRDEHANSAARVDAAEAATDAERRRADLERARANSLDRELEQLRATKTFRYLDAPRRAYARLRRRRA